MEDGFVIIKGFSGYKVNNKGVVVSLIKKKPGTFTSKEHEIKRMLSKNGYEYIRIKSDNNGSKKLLIHRLIAIYFLENKCEYKCVNHKNGIRNDNRIENLEWCSYSQNSKHGYDSNGRKNPLRKLTEEEVKNIKSELIEYKYGTGIKLAKKYNVSKYIISLIHKNKTYKSVI